MIKNSIFDVYDRMDKKMLESMAMSYETDFVVAKDGKAREVIKGRLAIVYALLKYKFKKRR